MTHLFEKPTFSLRRVVVLALLTVPMLAPTVGAATQRILYVGDSWTAFPWNQNPPALRDVLSRPEVGLGAWEENGSIALLEATAERWDTQSAKDAIRQQFEANPTIDIFHVSLGGNDINLNWRGNFSPDQTTQLLDTTVAHIRNVVEFCLSLRPDMRVAIVGYDYINLTEGFSFDQFGIINGFENATITAYGILGLSALTLQDVLNNQNRVNQVFIGLEDRKKNLAQQMDRVTYVHNLGLMQSRFGVPILDVPAGAISLPDGPAQNYSNFPNGVTNGFTPREAMAGSGELDPIHLSESGYVRLMENVVVQAYAAWLSDNTAPQAVAIRRAAGAEDPTDVPVLTFEVQFSEGVSGVSADDFVIDTAKSISNAAITGVQGGGANYTVTVDRGTGEGVLSIDLIDNGSIHDSVWNTLGPTALNEQPGDGDFTNGEAYTIVEPPDPEGEAEPAVEGEAQEGQPMEGEPAEGEAAPPVEGESGAEGESAGGGEGDVIIIIEGEPAPEGETMPGGEPPPPEGEVSTDGEAGTEGEPPVEGAPAPEGEQGDEGQGPVEGEASPEAEPMPEGATEEGEPAPEGAVEPEGEMGEGEAATEGALEPEGEAAAEGESGEGEVEDGAGGEPAEGAPEGDNGGEATEGENPVEGAPPEGEGQHPDGEGLPGEPAPPHTADIDGDFAISLAELLRGVQLFAFGQYGCDPETEDGYRPGGANRDCPPHDADVFPQDWDIGLGELLRLVQLYNSPGYHPCPNLTEDGVCAGISG